MKTYPRLLCATGAALAMGVATAPAYAQSPDDASAMPSSPAAAAPDAQPYPASSEPDKGDWYSKLGFAIAVGGGVTGFTDSAMRDVTGTAGGWVARLSIGTRSPVGFEVSYLGSAQSIDAEGLDNDAILLGNGIQGTVRVNVAAGLPATPFVFGGAAWTRYSLRNTDYNTSLIADDDDVLEIPVGLGVSGTYRGLALDLRGEFRFAAEADLVPENLYSGVAGGDSAPMHRWGVNASVGFGF